MGLYGPDELDDHIINHSGQARAGKGFTAAGQVRPRDCGSGPGREI